MMAAKTAPARSPRALLEQALQLHRAGKLDAAEALYRQVRVADPRNFDALQLSALLAQQQGRLPEALTLFQSALRVRPDANDCQLRYASALASAGRHTEAEKILRLLARRGSAEAWDQLALVLKMQDRLGDAIAAHDHAVKLAPQNAAFWCNRGLGLSLAGDYAAALESQEHALRIAPDFAAARFGRAQSLHQLHRLAEAVADYDRFLTTEPRHTQARSYRLFALQHLGTLSREALFAEHVEYGRIVNPAPARAFPNSRDPERRLRVGVVSPDLREHSCAYFLEPLLRHLDRAQFEIVLYHDHFREDTMSARFREHASAWRNTVSLADSAFEKLVRDDTPDVLIDLAGHTGTRNRLPVFARRLAPVQITYLGYPDTTGVPAMDYRFVDPISDPEGEADAFATEKLVRFSSTAWCYSPPADSPEVSSEPRPADRPLTFGSFNHPAKLTDATLACWAELLAQTPGSRLLLKGSGLGGGPERAAFEARLARNGLPLDRVELLERTPDTRSHLQLYARIDVALDTFPYHGTTTTCEALWMGVPVVTLAGDRHVSRVGASLLSAVGLDDCIATTPADYVKIAQTQSKRIDDFGRKALRERMQRSVLMDHAGQAARFGAAVRACWRESCRTLARPGT